MDPNRAIQNTLHWVDKVIIGENLCPFAKKERDQQSIRALCCDEKSTEYTLQALLDEFAYLEENPKTETTLFILPSSYLDFFDYLDLVDMANQLLVKEDYEGIFQLATFHPAYLFDGAPADDPSHYTNRSPYPMLHIIREESLEKALNHFPNPEAIPERNIRHAQSLGAEFFKQILGYDSSKH
ncbi:DUF1415 domain-containing protein [Glaciecola sp. MH2013]|nr:DUF1415 domain-containing protein [Glaciecola sp. MH2013]